MHLVDGIHPIMYNVSDNYNTMIFYSGNIPRDSPCFVLKIDPSDSTVALFQEVTRFNKMFVSDDDPVSRNVIRAAADIAGRRGVKHMFFTDCSYMGNSFHDRIYLADLSFLITGQTWYETILSPLRCISPEGDDLEHYRYLARTNTWRQVGHGLVDVNIPSHIDIDVSGSAMEMLNFMKSDRRFHDFLVKNLWKLPRRSGIYSLIGTDWVYHPSPIVLPNRRNSRRQWKGRRRTTRKGV